MNILVTKNTSKNIQNFMCEKCDFICFKKGDWTRHILTTKHQRVTLGDESYIKKTSNYQCPNCSKTYSSRNGLWKHKKICMNEVLDSSNNEIKILANLVLDVVNQNKELQKQIIDICKDKNNITNNTITNNKFNLHIFLNETCKDAMNIMDFVNSVQPQLTDLENMGKLGYVDGISNIIINNLKALDVTKRPVHCSDVKREVLYVKDKDEWFKEKEKLKDAIKHIAHKNIKMIPQWKEINPEYNYDNCGKNDEYIKIISQSMGGYDKKENMDYENKIISKVAKTILIEKE
jgi:hypothetical protein